MLPEDSVYLLQRVSFELGLVVILVLRRLKQEDHEFKAFWNYKVVKDNLGKSVRLCFKIKSKKWLRINPQRYSTCHVVQRTLVSNHDCKKLNDFKEVR